MTAATIDVGVSPNRIVWDGQSLNIIPSPTFPGQTMANLPGGIPYKNPSIGSTQWDSLLSSAPNRVFHLGPLAANNILVMNGGQSDLFTEFDSGAQVYADHKAYALAARTAGFDRILVTTIVPADSSYGCRTTITAPSNGVDVATFAGSGTVNVIDASKAISVGAPQRVLIIQTSTGQATVSYAGKTATTFTGCTTTAGTGTLATGNYCRNLMEDNRLKANALILANSDSAFDTVIDLASNSQLQDTTPSGSGGLYYDSVGLHWSVAGAGIAATVATPLIASYLT